MKRMVAIIGMVIGIFYMTSISGVIAEESKASKSVTPPAAASAATSSGLSWAAIKVRLTHLKQGLMSSAVERHYQRRSVAAVAAVRGAPQKLDDPDKPYWKGAAEAKKARALKEERAEFESAVDLLLDGKNEEGIKKLNEFEVKHPKSSLLKDVRETREMVQKGMATPPTSTPQP